jgi:hypothetical protein
MNADFARKQQYSCFVRENKHNTETNKVGHCKEKYPNDTEIKKYTKIFMHRNMSGI